MVQFDMGALVPPVKTGRATSFGRETPHLRLPEKAKPQELSIILKKSF